ncbi:MAG: TonB-dependent receptor, partial [Myxococcota bacterium]
EEGSSAGAPKDKEKEDSDENADEEQLPQGEEEFVEGEVEGEEELYDPELDGEEFEDDFADVSTIREIEVIGQDPRELLQIPGSAAVITREQLEDQAPVDVHEVLRTVPGVHAVDEEGLGLRPNIGFRGLDPERSRGVLLMEDGVPIASAPYTNAGMYYTTPLERIDRIEIVKGSGSILYGPQTIGGVINYITKPVPEDFEASARARGGNFGYLVAGASLGDSTGGNGYFVDVNHKRFTGPTSLELISTDILAKLRVNVGPRQSLSMKVSVYDEFSRATYIGLTTPQYQADPATNFATFDRFAVRRYGAALNHSLLLGEDSLLQTRAYAWTLSREWQRQDFDRCNANFGETCEAGDYERVITGDGTQISPQEAFGRTDVFNGSSIFFEDSTGNRNRYYSIAGVETRLTTTYELGELGYAELLAGARVHTEQWENRRINGENGGSPSGDIREDEEITGNALALYALNRFIMLDERFRVSPGIRLEYLNSLRKLYRDGSMDVNEPVLNDAGEVVGGGPAENTLNVFELIPGVGVSYDAMDELTLFTGVHRGYAPPRVQDAVDEEGAPITLAAERSLNVELGGRVRLEDYLYSELSGFLMNFSNQIVEPTESAGEAIQGGLINNGETTHVGVEVGGTYDPLAMLEVAGMQAPITVSYTFSRARFGDGWEGVGPIEGNVIPYAPQHMWTIQANYQLDSGLRAQLLGNYIGSQFADETNREFATNDGTNGLISRRFILNARVGYFFDQLGLDVFVAGNNLVALDDGEDEQRTYIASRRPQGIKPAGFLQLFGGAQWRY